MTVPFSQSDDPAVRSVEKYLEWGEGQLFAALGAELVGGGLGLGSEDQDANERFARKWFSRNVDELRSKICFTPQAQALMGAKGDRTAEAVTIAELLSEATSLGSHPSMLVSVLITRMGLTMFCRDATPR
ncbi:hypothetical protein ACIHIX_46875 [Streptomyces sp. NPDC051913]|uniref:hypothetical protein n=1 Tax=Streptomyces sp. NPDC051913 TaxID=3365676 RepID=UPI0037D7CDD9